MHPKHVTSRSRTPCPRLPALATFFLTLLLTSCQESEKEDKNRDRKKTENSSSSSQSTPLIRIETQRPLMGTLFRITSHARNPQAGYEAMEEALDLAEDLAERATDYHPDSELNQLTKAPLHSPTKVSPLLFELLLLSQKIAQQTEGLFDPTYGPLTQLWRETKRLGITPSQAELSDARERCGIQHLRFNEAQKTITLLRSDLQLDLGGIAKGFAADLIFDHLVNPPPGKNGWNIGLRSFRLTPTSTLTLKNCAVSTSGDLFQNITADGQKYSHLIDPKTGLGLTTRRSASVILPQAKLTDPLATAACLTDNPKSLLKHYPKASIRVLYENPDQGPKTPPITTGLFE